MTLAAVNKAALRSTPDVEKDDLSRMIHASSSLLCEQQQFPRNIQLETLLEGAVHVAQDFFSVQECQAWIDMFNAKARMERVSHPASRSMAHRERRRWQLNDWGLSEQIFLRIQRPILSQGLDFRLLRENPIACNGNLRLYKYNKGMRFGRHIDELNETDKGTTLVTVLIYLSD
jgi:hypothetical protein